MAAILDIPPSFSIPSRTRDWVLRAPAPQIPVRSSPLEAGSAAAETTATAPMLLSELSRQGNPELWPLLITPAAVFAIVSCANSLTSTANVFTGRCHSLLFGSEAADEEVALPQPLRIL